MDVDAVNLVVSAISAGAVAGAKDTATQAVKDAYVALKRLITDRYTGVDLIPVVAKPTSTAKRESLAEDLTDAGAAVDQELITAARHLLATLAEHDPAAGQAIGLDIADLAAANVRVSDITATGAHATGVKMRKVTVSGDLEVSRVHADTTAGDPPAPSLR